MQERIVSPSKITAWLDCAHYLTLRNQLDDGVLQRPNGGTGSFAKLLAEKGLAHEQACLERYRASGLDVLEVPERKLGESFAQWLARVGDPLATDADVLYQVPFQHDGIRGIADFLERGTAADGTVIWEPVDAKLARVAAKPGHVLQLCFYADAIAARTGRSPRQVHLELGSGARESIVVAEVAPYWRRLRGRLRSLLDSPADTAATYPEPCSHCSFCEFAPLCEQQWRDDDSLVNVAGLRSIDRVALEAADVATIAALAESERAVAGLDPDRWARSRTQAQLQRKSLGADRPAYVAIDPGLETAWGHGFSMLPEPDDGDVFLDFEGHPFWRADRGLFFLYGWIEKVDGDWTYRALWAHDEEEELTQAAELVRRLTERRETYPRMHVYHYNHTERSSLQRLLVDAGRAGLVLNELVDSGAFVDLYEVARNAVQVGTESYGLKHLERLTSYARSHEIDKGAGAVVAYEEFMSSADPHALTAIATYNEDDVRATRALRDWLVEQRPADLPFRDSWLEPDVADEGEVDELVASLQDFEPGSLQHFLGDVLGYWRREWRAVLAQMMVACQASAADQRDAPEVIAGLVDVGLVPRLGAKGKELNPGRAFTFPPQDLSAFKGKDLVLFLDPEGAPQHATVDQLDEASGTVVLLWKLDDERVPPSCVVRNGWVSVKTLFEALCELGRQVLADDQTASSLALALLRRDLPVIEVGHGPSDGKFGNALQEMLAWGPHLDGSFVAVQGPPGTGKTYRGSHLVRALLNAGLRVGITATSHAAVDNLLRSVVELYRAAGDLPSLSAVRKDGTLAAGLDGVSLARDNRAAARQGVQLVAGTPWLYASQAMRDHPVDVLVIDEAGQMGLAAALAAAGAARNVVLLGDPLQLPQVSLATHPNGSGASVLEHVLGQDRTLPAERGVFLAETRRMHPDVADFISDVVYEGRLTSHPSCAIQDTALGTGLRWVPVHHQGCSTLSEVEALAVRDLARELLGQDWTNASGETAPLGVEDLLVVSPYNDQVARISELLDADPRTRGVRVGTVDKFQGQEAAVVLFSMATSCAEDMVRGADFLFSRNRFNVAISRARCLVYLVCTEELLDTRATDVEDMKLISTLCAFVERAASVAPSG